jgi:phosphoribosylanthranilate isomerase
VPIEAKICGINSPEALRAAGRGGARFVGFNFYPRSPRVLTPGEAGALAARVPPGVSKVGLFVDPDDDQLAATLERVAFDLLQLHGSETPERVAQIRARFGLPVMKVIKVATAEDLAGADDYLGVVDRLMFDAKAPQAMKSALPGGNAVAFDWRLLAGRSWTRPWMLAGGLHADNLAEAVGISGARAVDVSSGVEERPGVKSPEKIAAFLDQARAL